MKRLDDRTTSKQISFSRIVLAERTVERKKESRSTVFIILQSVQEIILHFGIVQPR